MPELPEVETIVRELRPQLVGRRIAAVRIGKKKLRRPWQRHWTASLIGKKIRAVARRGKWILLRLTPPASPLRRGGMGGYLVFHLGMTGQLTVVPADQPLVPHTHVVMDLQGPPHPALSPGGECPRAAGKRQLRFRDIRRFGAAMLFADEKCLQDFLQDSGLGPEPFGLEPEYWRNCLSRTRRCLKAVLLDQRVLAGVGNIYADEALFEARIHPMRLGRKVRSEEAGRLRRAIVTVLNRAIDKRGSSIRDYVDGSGREGEYQNEFRVYSRAGQPCVRCSRPIRRMRLAGRSTYYCPKCQRQERNSKNQEPNSKARTKFQEPNSKNRG